MQQGGYGTNRRGKSRVKKIFGPMVEMTVQEGGGMSRTHARIVDYHEGGFGFLCHEAISPGSIVDFEDEQNQKHHAKVTWCQKTRGGEYRLGVSFDVHPADSESDKADSDSDTVDYYELLQLNPKADGETIHRVYRLQAQRFHPDNKETGDAATFKLMHEAYTVLSDAEKRKRSGLLALLYAKRMQSPATPTISNSEFENLLGIPKEHLELALWYLRESSCVARSDDAKFTITVRGVDEVEQTPAAIDPQRAAQVDRLLA